MARCWLNERVERDQASISILASRTCIDYSLRDINSALYLLTREIFKFS